MRTDHPEAFANPFGSNLLLRLLVAVLLAFGPQGGHARSTEEQTVRATVAAAVRPVMREYDLPGLALAVTFQGRHHVVNFGVASRSTGAPVDDNTLFEIGSISKTYVATLAALAEVRGRLTLQDGAEVHLPALAGTSIGKVSLADLGTHSAGGFPLQLPSDVVGEERLWAYFRDWQPAYAAGTHRTYANPGIGLLGRVAAASLAEPYGDAVRRSIFEPLGLWHTYLVVPPGRMTDYAQGYNKQDRPVRMTGDALSDQTFGVKTTMGDLIRFVDANLGRLEHDAELGRAIGITQQGRLQVGRMTQALVWESYACPARLQEVLDSATGNMVYETVPAQRVESSRNAPRPMLILKSGSTGGFGALVAFLPGEQVGVAMAANRNFPIEARIRIAWQVMSRLGLLDGAAQGRRPSSCLVPALPTHGAVPHRVRAH